MREFSVWSTGTRFCFQGPVKILDPRLWVFQPNETKSEKRLKMQDEATDRQDDNQVLFVFV